MAAFWEHEKVLNQFCIEVALCKASGPKHSLPEESDSAEKTLEQLTQAVIPSAAISSACKVCKSEGRGDPCGEYIAGPLRRVNKETSEKIAMEDLSESGGSVTLQMSSSSPIGKKAGRSNSTGMFHRNSKRSRFVERRCKGCGHLALDHTAEGKTSSYMMYLEFKTRAAYESNIQSHDDVVSETMKNCITRLYEPSVMEILDEEVPDDEMTSFVSSMDDDLSATESSMLEKDTQVPDEIFRLSLWKAKDLPARVDGTPHTWVMQVKCGKSIISSSAKQSNEPSWNEHFHFKYKPGRKVYIRILATDEPKVDAGKLKVRLDHEAAVRSRSTSRNGGSLSKSAGKDMRLSMERNKNGERINRFSDSYAGNNSNNTSNSSISNPSSANTNNDEEESTDDLLGKSARQWRNIIPKDKNATHGQVLLSLQMGVSLLDPLALIKPIADGEPDGVANVLPPDSSWALFEDVVPTLETGDVIVFIGHGWVGSTVQKYVQRPWIHIGLYMRFAEYDMNLVWELTPSKSLDVSDKRTGMMKLNVQLTDIRSKLRDGKYFRVAVRKLDCERTSQMVTDVMALKKEIEAQDGFARFLTDFVENTQYKLASEDLSAHFSAELLATAYKTMGLIPMEAPLSNYGPQFWLQEGPIDFNGAQLQPCVQIERSYEAFSKSFIINQSKEVSPM